MGPKSNDSLRILVVRPDRLGDVMLSTPVFESVKRHYSNSHLTILVKNNVLPILKGLISIDHAITFDPDGIHAGIRGFFRLFKEIRQGKFQIAVVLQSHRKIAAALFLARIKIRVGPLSKLHSFLFYNRGIRQRRSKVEMHEADYNLQLLQSLGIHTQSKEILTRVDIPQTTLEASRRWLLERGWRPKEALVLIHPGMGGSALNWPEEHYQELVYRLAQEGKQVLVTGGPTEGELLDRMESSLGEFKSRVLFYRGSPQAGIDYWGGLCFYSQLVIAPSTGPLHVAVALKKPVVTFYPPIRVQSPRRWGPYVEDPCQASVWVPQVECGQDFECLGKKCKDFPCMKTLSVGQTLNEIGKQLNSNQKSTSEKTSGESS